MFLWTPSLASEDCRPVSSSHDTVVVDIDLQIDRSVHITTNSDIDWRQSTHLKFTQEMLDIVHPSTASHSPPHKDRGV